MTIRIMRSITSISVRNSGFITKQIIKIKKSLLIINKSICVYCTWIALLFGIVESRDINQSKAGKPNNSGWKSSRDLMTRVASRVIDGSILSSGTITTCIPAARAARTPLTASSKTRHYIIRKDCQSGFSKWRKIK